MLSMSPFCIAMCKKLRPLLSNCKNNHVFNDRQNRDCTEAAERHTCSAAVGIFLSIAWAALSFRQVSAVANGVSPLLSRSDNDTSIAGWQSNKLMIIGCWLYTATCNGVLSSMSWAEGEKKTCKIYYSTYGTYRLIHHTLLRLRQLGARSKLARLFLVPRNRISATVSEGRKLRRRHDHRYLVFLDYSNHSHCRKKKNIVWILTRAIPSPADHKSKPTFE
jgi:hypothetical protein